MSYEMLMYIGLGVGIFFLVLSLLLFFMLKIPAAVSELTGRTAKREIEAIISRERNEDGRGQDSRKTEKLRSGGFSFGRRSRNTEDLLNQGREALKERLVRGVTPVTPADPGNTVRQKGQYVANSPHINGEAVKVGSLAAEASAGEGTVLLSPDRFPKDSMKKGATLSSGDIEPQTARHDGTVLLSGRDGLGTIRQNGTELLAPNQMTDSLRSNEEVHQVSNGSNLLEDHSDETISLANHAGFGEMMSDRDECGEWSPPVSGGRETQRLDSIATNTGREKDDCPNPAVYIEDRVIIVHTDELISVW